MEEGHSGTPLPRKLGIEPGHRVELAHAPDGFELELPEGARVARSAHQTVDVVLAFFTRRAELEAELPRLRELMEAASSLWVAWPKKASRVPTDITEDVVREIALSRRLVDTKVCAIDAVWSGLRLVIRLRDR